MQFGILKDESGWICLYRSRTESGRALRDESRASIAPLADPARLSPCVCFLNLYANSTRLLGNISRLVYTNNVRYGHKLRKGNTNASEHRPQVKHSPDNRSHCYVHFDTAIANVL